MGDGKKLDYLFVLNALKEIPFGVGRKLLIDFLQGKEKNESISRNKLYLKKNFGIMAYGNDELDAVIDNLLLNNMVKTVPVNSNKFWKVLELTAKGRNEIDSPSLYKRKLSFNLRETKTTITEEDKKLFDAFGSILSEFNDAQKKAIISSKGRILCMAGAGSGKTTVLTKRAEFIVKYRSVDPKKILAITFTRKARQEMITRLSRTGMNLVIVETFNSFCEKILRQYNNVVYTGQVRVVSYKDRIIMLNKALSNLNMDIRRAIVLYFGSSQRKGKTDEQLANIFMNDCFFLRDYFKFKNKPIEKSSFEDVDINHKKSAEMLFGVCNYIETYMKKNKLRDFADQLIDTINLFEKHKELIPKFEHLLIDEYQDINLTQINLVDILSPANLFCVGDPRQAIYGWRGSNINYLLNFEEKYPGCDIISLTKNYRSTRHIVELINSSIKSIGLADLESSKEGEKDIKLLKFNSEDIEFEFVIQGIIASGLPKNEIFVLARTHRQLNELSQIMKTRGLKHIIKSDETRKSITAGKDEITLSTIHSIKGLEAEMVFVIGCTPLSFPCRGSEHPVIGMVKIDEYDKEEEEKRLFYVAMSRARKSLYLTYSGRKHTNFITNSMLEMMDMIAEEKQEKLQPEKNIKINKSKSNNVMIRLREWRRQLSNELGIPAFMIMHDRTMIELVQKMPLTSAELEDIRGMGPVKIMKYGKEILRIVCS